MKKPTPQINRPGSKPVVPVAKKPEAPAEVEIPAAEGLTVVEGQEYTVEETASEQPSLTIPEDPLPSTPVEEPVVQTPAPVVQDGMAYLGTFVLDGMVSRGNNGRVASLPVVVVSGGRVIGVLAVSDPGLVGDALAGIIAGLLAQQPHKPPFESARTACLWLGTAGQRAAGQYGVHSVLTGDVIACMKEAAVSGFPA